MATVRKRGESYQIRVSCGYTVDGHQVTRTKTWKPTAGMTEKQQQKELNRQAIIFEEDCLNGYVNTSIKLGKFMEQWKNDYAIHHFKQTTIDTMTKAAKRINEEMGHMRLDKITRRTIQMFVKSLASGDKTHKRLGAKSIKNYVSFASSIFEYAIQLDMISNNPCSRVKIPKSANRRREMYTIEEAQEFLDALMNKAPLLYRCYFVLAIYSGFRRGEICGLTWDNIDFENNVITVEKALYHVSHKGDVIETPKTAYSNRSLRLTDDVFILLRELQDFYAEEAVRLDGVWHETDFVFKRHDGRAISPIMPNEWLHRFCEEQGLRYVTPHSFRHLNASIMISEGVDVKNVQASLGHSSASTTLNIYAHVFSKVNAIASQTVASKFKLHQDAVR